MQRAWLVALLLGGCVVEDPSLLDDGFWACTMPEDCGDGWSCAEGNVYSADFCRPGCDRDDPSTCPDGVCTVTGACLQGCAIDADGTAEDCRGDDFECVRIDAYRAEGVCYPAQSCSRTADCERDGMVPQLCLNEALGLPSMTVGENIRFDNLYCTAAPDRDGRCPTGYLSFAISDESGATRDVCFPPCRLGDDGPFCPPATTCFRGFGELVGLPETPPCLPGFWGLPCEDDTHCLLGRCLPVGDGSRACTETCDDAEGLAGGCSGLEQIGALFGVNTRMTCEDIGGTQTCVPRYDLLSLCDSQLDCAGGSDVQCAEVVLGGDTRAHVCLRFCSSNTECFEGTGGAAEDYRCVDTPTGGGICSRRRQLGARCTVDADCREGRCCDLGSFNACLTACP